MASKSFTQFFPIRPKAKGRPRMTRSGHAYTPKATLDFERLIASAYEGPHFGSVPLQAVLRFTKKGIKLTLKQMGDEPYSAKGKLTGDLDNYMKSCLDALNNVAFDDDEQIIDLRSTKG